jgi:hypothetical protein
MLSAATTTPLEHKNATTTVIGEKHY